MLLRMLGMGMQLRVLRLRVHQLRMLSVVLRLLRMLRQIDTGATPADAPADHAGTALAYRPEA